MLVLTVRNQELIGTKIPPVKARQENYLAAEFKFSSDWDGLIKTAQFWRKYEKEYYPQPVNEKGVAEVPWEVTVKPGSFFITVFATNNPGDSNKVITTNAVEIFIDEEGMRSDPNSKEPSQGVFGKGAAEALKAIDDHAKQVVGLVNTAGDRAVADINIAEDNAKTNILGVETAGMDDIRGATGKALQSINTTADSGAELILSNQNKAITLISETKTAAVNEIDVARQTALTEVAQSSTAAASSASSASQSATEAKASLSAAQQAVEDARTQASSATDQAKKAKTEADKAASMVAKFAQPTEGSITLTNTEVYPFNNSQQTVALLNRLTNNYIVLTEVVKADGNVGSVEISEQLNNGFKIKFTGSASSVTVNYKILGGE